MSAKTLNLKDAAAAKIQVVDNAEKGNQAVHDLVVAYQANRRAGTACTKTRGEVRGSGKKIYRQKGTGNARHGDRQAPIFVGGGVVFGPRPRDYSKNVPKSVRRLALRKVLGEQIKADAVFSVPSFEVADGKTKSFISAVKELTDAKKVLIVGQFSEETKRAGRNVQPVQLSSASDVNIEQLLHANAVILLEDSFETLAARTA